MTKKRFTEITGIEVVTQEIIGDEADKLAAVKRDGDAIRYIANPSEAVQLAAVARDGYAIRYIANPSEAVQFAAVDQNALAIQYFKDSWFDAE